MLNLIPEVISTHRINIAQGLSNVSWDSAKKHSDISLLNAGTTAKLKSVMGLSKSVFAKNGYLIGTDTDVIALKIHNGPLINVGFMGDDDIGLTSLVMASLDDEITLTLTTTTLTLSHHNTSKAFSLAPFVGKVMFPWLSDDTNSAFGFSVTINRISGINVSINKQGYAVVGSISNGAIVPRVVFDTGVVEFKGGISAPVVTYDVVESSIATLTLRASGGDDVTIDTNGGVSASSLTIGSVPADNGIAFAVSDDAGSKAMLLPRTTNRLGITPTQEGMFVYDSTDKNVFVHDGTAWAAAGGGAVTSSVVSTGNVTPYFATTADIIMANATTMQTVTIPDPSASNAGKKYLIIKYSTVGNVIVNTVSGAAVFDGSIPSVTMTVQYDKLEVVSTGLHWFMV